MKIKVWVPVYRLPARGGDDALTGCNTTGAGRAGRLADGKPTLILDSDHDASFATSAALLWVCGNKSWHPINSLLTALCPSITSRD